jgi:hypothetical protein
MADLMFRFVSLVIGAVASGVAFGWIAGVAAFFLFLSIMPPIVRD